MSWSDVDPFGLIPARPVTDLVFDPQDSDLLYAALGGFDHLSEGPFQHVFVTREAFETSPEWHNISPPIDIPVQSLAVLPQETDILYAGTDLVRHVSGGAETGEKAGIRSRLSRASQPSRSSTWK